MKKTLNFDIKTKETLNSNSLPNHIIVKSNRASAIRKLAAKIGVDEHDYKELAQERLNALEDEEKISITKGRTTRKLNKEAKEQQAKLAKDENSIPSDEIITPEFIAEQLLKIEKDLAVDISSKDITVPYLFNVFTVKVTVLAPTKRRVDPPNFYPTIKHIIDGLTYASWWEDDNFNQLVNMSFEYGGISGIKDTYRFILDIEEVDKSSNEVLS